MTEKQYKNLYGIFVGVFVINVAYAIWNIRESHKLRQLQTELAKRQISELDKKEAEKVS